MENKYKHIMLDIETMGNSSYSSIVSIGAVKFDINTGDTGDEFYINIDLQSCIDLGLGISASTVMWWMEQSDEARKGLTSGNVVSITEALKMFAEFCDEDCEIWGNSARFDCGILGNAYNKAGIPIPWNFRNERCVRTLTSFAPDIKRNYPDNGVKHNALSDCYFQIGYCSTIWNSLRN